jgi:hypothetical protein
MLTLPADRDRLLPTERQQISVLENIDEATSGEGLFDGNGDALFPGAVAVGPPGQGTLTFNAAHLTTDEDSTTKYVHIRLPFQNDATHRWHIRAVGSASNTTAAEIVDITWIGLITSGASAPSRTAVLDPSGLGATQYKGSDDYVYLRFKPANIQHLDFVVHSLCVGDSGEVILPGAITVTTSASATL